MTIGIRNGKGDQKSNTKNEKFVGHFFFFFQKRKPVLKEKKRYEKGMAKKRRCEKG